jgi:hypothetical protein
MSLLAVDAWLTDVAIPLLAAVLTAAGIVGPLWYQRQKDRAEKDNAFGKALQAINRDAAFLVERLGLLVRRDHANEHVTDEEIDVISSVRERLMTRLFDDPRVYDAYFGRRAWLTQETEPTMLLLLGEVDSRLRGLQTTRETDTFTLFGLYLLLYAGETDPAEVAKLADEIRQLRADPEVDTFAEKFPLSRS